MSHAQVRREIRDRLIGGDRAQDVALLAFQEREELAPGAQSIPGR